MSIKINPETQTIWLNEKQAAGFIGVSRSTLFRLRKGGEISFSQVGRLIRYRRSDLDQFLLNHRIPVFKPP